MIFTPARKHRIMNAVVASLTDHHEVTLFQGQGWIGLNGDDVMDKQALLLLSADRAAALGTDDHRSPEVAPGSFPEIRPHGVKAAAPIVMRRSGYRGQVVGVTQTRAEAPSAVVGGCSTGFTGRRMTLPSLRLGSRLERLEAGGATGLVRLGRPVLDIDAAGLTGGDHEGMHAAPVDAFTALGAPTLAAVGCIEACRADRTCFEHAIFY